MNLNKLADTIKQNRKVFFSQQSEIKYKLESLGFSSEFDVSSWRDLTLAVGLTMTGLLSMLVIYLLCRMSRIAASLALIPLTASASVMGTQSDEQFGHFVFQKPEVVTPQPSEAFKLNIDLAYHTSYIQTLMMIMIAINLLIIVVKSMRSKPRKSNYGFQICINFFNDRKSVLVFAQKIGEASTNIQFSCTEFIRNVQLRGSYGNFDLFVQWGLKIVHGPSNKIIKFQSVIKLGFWEARVLKQIIDGGDYFAIPLLLDENGKINGMNVERRMKKLTGSELIEPAQDALEIE